MSVVELKPTDRSEDCIKVASNFAENEASKFDVVLILGIDKNGAQHLFGSNCSHMERSFIHAFFTAWILKWFRLGESNE